MPGDDKQPDYGYGDQAPATQEESAGRSRYQRRATVRQRRAVNEAAGLSQQEVEATYSNDRLSGGQRRTDETEHDEEIARFRAQLEATQKEDSEISSDDEEIKKGTKRKSGTLDPKETQETNTKKSKFADDPRNSPSSKKDNDKQPPTSGMIR